jgi:hypothetical protein
MGVPGIANMSDISVRLSSIWFFSAPLDKKDAQGYNSGLFITIPTREPTGTPYKKQL